MPALAERSQRGTSEKLTALERLTCEGVAEGLSQAKSYKLARRNLGLSEYKDTSASVTASFLVNQPKCKEYIKRLQQIEFEGKALTLAEKRAFLAGSVRTIVSEAKDDSPYIQEKTVTYDKNGNEVIKLKLVNKLQAIEIDNKMAGHNYGDTDDVNSNPFGLIVNFTQNNIVNQTSGAAPGQDRTIEAEIITEDI